MADNPTNWIEEAIAKEHFKYYEYEYFGKVEEIGEGAFGKVYRANWKNSERYLALKSFSKFDSVTAKEIVRELKLQRQVGFHNNICLYGVTLENQDDGPSKNYSLVMEYADGGTLKQYLKTNFNKLTWKNKLNIAFQLACAVSCLHNEEIVHGDLHSGNILICQNNVKLADFGLSKRIGEASNKFFGLVPYIDPKDFSNKRNNNDQEQIYSPSSKNDIYSVGVLLWEISSGRSPFDNKPYDIDLAAAISQGLRETIIPGTPIDYSDLYMECWNGNPDHRPTISKVINRLKVIMSTDNLDNTVSEQQLLNPNVDRIKKNSKISSPGLNKMITNKVIESSTSTEETSSNKREKNKSLNEIVNDVVKFIELIKGSELERYLLYEYAKSNNINLQDIYNFLVNNRNLDSNSMFLLGTFNNLGIGTNNNNQKAAKFFQVAAGLGHKLAQRSLAQMCNDEDDIDGNLAMVHKDGIGVNKNERKAFELFKESAEGGHLDGMNMLGECYYYGKGTHKNRQKAFELFQKAANLGNSAAKCNLDRMYKNGETVERNLVNYFEPFKSSVEGLKNLLNKK